MVAFCFFFFFQAEDGIRYWSVTGVQTCALPIYQDEREGEASTPPSGRAVPAASALGRIDERPEVVRMGHDGEDGVNFIPHGRLPSRQGPKDQLLLRGAASLAWAIFIPSQRSTPCICANGGCHR